MNDSAARSRTPRFAPTSELGSIVAPPLLRLTTILMLECLRRIECRDPTPCFQIVDGQVPRPMGNAVVPPSRAEAQPASLLCPRASASSLARSTPSPGAHATLHGV